MVVCACATQSSAAARPVSSVAVRAPQPPTSTRTSLGPRRPPEAIRRLAAEVYAELTRAFKGITSDSLTIATVWRSSAYEEDRRPLGLSPRQQALLRELFRPVPPGLLDSLTWADSIGTFASPELGVVADPKRLASLAWSADSSLFSRLDERGRSLVVRPVGDYLVAIILAHEASHLALHFAGIADTLAVAVLECSADVLGSFVVSTIAPRLSSNARWDLNPSLLATTIEAQLSPGDWRNTKQHPDGEQRAKCIANGMSLKADLDSWQRFAGNTVLDSRRDSLLDDLSVGRATIAQSAVSIARELLALPIVSEKVGEPSLAGRLERLSGAHLAVLTLYDSLLSRLETVGDFSGLRGAELSRGATLFPTALIRELRVTVPAPWKCAIMPPANGRGESAACYAVEQSFNASIGNFEVRRRLLEQIARRGLTTTAIGPATMRDSRLGIEQWLVQSVRGNRAVVSIYTESLHDLTYQWTGRTVRWFSFMILPNK